MNRIVVIDANAFWTEQLFRQSGRHRRVLLLKPRDFRAHRAKSGSLWSDPNPTQICENVWEQRLSMPPGWMSELWWYTESKIARVIKDFTHGSSYSLVITYPQYRGLISKLKPSQSVYYNLDDYRDNWPRYGSRVPQWESETVDVADVTICIARQRVTTLAAEHPGKQSAIHHLPIGCTPEFMSNTVASSPVTFPSELAGLARPIGGYVGALNYRFDFQLIAAVSELLPEMTFVLGGRVIEDGDATWKLGLEAALKRPNIRFLGWVEHGRLGEFLNSFDVLLMPYSHCNFNTNACPAKLWDYLGTGKPIVANDANPETLDWKEVVRIGGSAREFAEAVKSALAETGEELRQKRLSIASDHTWEQLNHRLEKIIAF